jgi:protein TonB
MSGWRAVVAAVLPAPDPAVTGIGLPAWPGVTRAGRGSLWTPAGLGRPVFYSLLLHLVLSLGLIPPALHRRPEPVREVKFSSARLVQLVPPGPAAAARLRPASTRVRPPEPPPEKQLAHVVPKRLPSPAVTPRTRETPRDATPPRAGASRADAPKMGPVTGRMDAGSVVRSTLPQVGDHGGALEIRVDGEELGYNYYFSMLLRKIGEYWEPPPGAWGDEVAAVIRFTVFRDGSAPPVSVEEPSGIAAFDAAAMRAVTRSAPLPPLPQEYAGENIVFHLRFVYSRDTGPAGRN